MKHLIMVKKSLMIVFVMISVNLFSQNRLIDSLNSELKFHKKDNVKQAKLLHEIGKAYFEIWDYENAITNFKKSTAIFISNKAFKDAAIDFEYLGHANSDINDFKEALLNYNQALEYYQLSKNESNVAGCLCNIGILYAEKTNILPAALKYYNEALKISIKIKDSLTMLKTLNNMGNLYELNGNYEKAINCLEKSLAIQIKTGRSFFLGVTSNNLGNIYKKKGNYYKALKYLNDAVERSKKLNEKYGEAISMINIGDVYLGLEKYDSAMQYYNNGKLLMQEINNDYGIHSAFIGLGHCLSATMKHNEALVYAKKADEISSPLGLIGLQRDVYQLYSAIYKRMGDYQKALGAHEQFKILNDSLFNKNKVEKIIQLGLEYQYKQTLDSAKNRELYLTSAVKTTTQDLEKSKRNILLTFIIFLIIAIVLVIVIFNLKLRNQKTITQNIAIEQELLRTQMTPHFVFNSLSVLQGMILNKEEKKSISYLSKFSKLFRLVLENSREKLVFLHKEIEAIENYLILQNLEDNTYNYSIKSDALLNNLNIKIPPMLIQPFIENAIEHAFDNNIENKKIEIHIQLKEKKLICTIVDNGVGIDATREKIDPNKKSLATTITSERLEILSKDLKMEGAISIEDRKNFNESGTKVTIVIPYKIVESL